jgi:DNA-binding NarL/FixJ family response regulator
VALVPRRGAFRSRADAAKMPSFETLRGVSMREATRKQPKEGRARKDARTLERGGATTAGDGAPAVDSVASPARLPFQTFRARGAVVKILIADDHALFRESLRRLLEARGLEVVGEAANGREAVELSARLQPTLVLMDLSMPELDGIEATRRLAAEQPGVRVVMLTASTEDEDLFEALKAGAQGYLVKNLQAQEFFNLLDSALLGQPALTPELSRKVLRAFSRPAREERKDPDALTERELEVLALMAEGVTSNRHLARQLKLSENTVKFHVRNILDKLHLHNRAQAVGFALREKVIKPKPGG